MLNKLEIKKLIEEKSLIVDYINLDKQLTPNGIDLTAAEIFEFSQAGKLDFSNKERIVPEVTQVLPQKISPEDKFGWWQLKKGVYKVRTNETINMPNDLVALAFSRTSLLRMGVSTSHGVWDAGFRGRSEFILSVGNHNGAKIKQNARVAQLVFFTAKETESYNGIYQQPKG